MNLIDWIIVGILGLSVLVGLYRGFISSVASMGSCLISLGASYWLTPQVVDYFRNNTTLPDQIQSYTKGIVNLGDLAGQDITGLSSGQVQEVASKLPPPLNTLLEGNLTDRIYGTVTDTIADKAMTVTDYASRTVSVVILNVGSFLLTFIVLVILFHIIINLLNAIFKFPVLKQMNTVTGGLFGLLRGALLCFVALAVLPLFETLIPDVKTLADSSALAKLFDGGNLILSVFRGRL